MVAVGGMCVVVGVYGYRDGAFGWGGVCGGVVYVGLWGVELVSGGWLVCRIWELGVLSEA